MAEKKENTSNLNTIFDLPVILHKKLQTETKQEHWRERGHFALLNWDNETDVCVLCCQVLDGVSGRFGNPKLFCRLQAMCDDRAGSLVYCVTGIKWERQRSENITKKIVPCLDFLLIEMLSIEYPFKKSFTS